ncbi:MAG TPA: MauE/DoxX family redox-associated membrane protein [Sphingobacteriaceae bacterium]
MKRRNNSLSIFTSLTTVLLILLWVYAALSKLIDYEESREQMLNQMFPARMAEVLVWAVPVTELMVVGLLIFPKTVRAGLLASLLLLFQFTVYISIVMTGIVGWIPCSCGGVLEQMTWGQHLLFNLFFLALTLVAISFYSQTSQPKAFGENKAPDELSSEKDKQSSDIRPGYGKNGVEKLPRIRAPDPNAGRR